MTDRERYKQKYCLAPVGSEKSYRGLYTGGRVNFSETPKSQVAQSSDRSLCPEPPLVCQGLLLFLTLYLLGGPDG